MSEHFGALRSSVVSVLSPLSPSSDGASRSGLVCALWEIISRLMCDGEVDVYLAVRHVHNVRPEAIASVVCYLSAYARLFVRHVRSVRPDAIF